MQMIGKYVLVRTRDAGVHIGILRQCNGIAVLLAGDNAETGQCKDNDGSPRRLWRWRGANTLHEVSQLGVKQGSRISDPVPVILLTQAIEVIPCSLQARRILETSRWDS